jgi:hypothetical protein
MSVYERHPQGSTLRLLLCILAIVIGVLFYVNAWKVGLDHKAAGVIMVALGLLEL